MPREPQNPLESTRHQGTSHNWETYFSDQDRTFSVDQCNEYYILSFLKHLSRLFKAQADGASITSISRSGQETRISQADTFEGLSIEATSKYNTEKPNEIIYIIPQEGSWGQFLLTSESFFKLLLSIQAFPVFLSFVQTFGQRNVEDHHVRLGYQYRVVEVKRGVEKAMVSECCYNINYMERNHRPNGDPWSLRQLGVYQRISFETSDMKWILLHPPNKTQGILERYVEQSGLCCYGDGGLQNPMALHLVFIGFAALGWKEYIEELHSRLRYFEHKACFSQVGFNDVHDYSLAFLDCQNLYLLQKKLHQAVTAVDSCLDMIRGCIVHCCELEYNNKAFPYAQFIAKLKMNHANIECHRDSLLNIIEQSNGTAGLLYKILEFRNGKTLEQTNQAAHTHLDFLKKIAEKSGEDTSTIAKIARNSLQDSKTFKAMSLLATLYLPSTLIATIFSSNLIQLEFDTAKPNSSAKFVIAPQFWIFVVTAAAMTLGTMVCLVCLRRKQQSKRGTDIASAIV
ncbi:hypothetical protein L207DRAFT_641160 [Hyaloscypha variabilis F]|uniref:CorA-like transporter domain-containing protein n=1 Tax=Hyaloscypha variabilis (strain UAMH 11265 / GT02V1 / F) TaxID=1149755 RepID=A0A2J6QXI0_HYAVF|nr:hypothetical protein L207DRAFT_641160 [Hyaloscypha variabilis F]